MPTPVHPDVPDADTIRAALTRLAPDTPRRWGTLDATGMLEHCARLQEVYLGQRPAPWLVRMLGRAFGKPMLRKFAATSPFETPHDAKTLGLFRVEPASVDAGAFTATRDRLLAGFDAIDAKSGTWDHPLYGPLDAELAKAAVRQHTAHHLYQFGVLERPDTGG